MSDAETGISWRCPNCGANHDGCIIPIRGMFEEITSWEYLARISREERKPIDSGWKTKDEVKQWSRVKDKQLACSECFKILMNGPLYSEVMIFLAKNPVQASAEPASPRPYNGSIPFVPLSESDFHDMREDAPEETGNGT